MKHYAVYMLLTNGKAIRYHHDTMSKSDAIKTMRQDWSEAHNSKLCKAMYVANLKTGKVTDMCR